MLLAVNICTSVFRPGILSINPGNGGYLENIGPASVNSPHLGTPLERDFSKVLILPHTKVKGLGLRYPYSSVSKILVWIDFHSLSIHRLRKCLVHSWKPFHSFHSSTSPEKPDLIPRHVPSNPLQPNAPWQPKSTSPSPNPPG